MQRRTLLSSTIAFAASAVAVPGLAQASLPGGPVRLFVGFPAGGGTDVLARLIAERLRVVLERPVIVVNQPGATGLMSIDQLRRAPADGSVVGLVAMTSAVVLPLFKQKVDFDFARDFEPVANMVNYALAFSVSNQLQVDDWPSFMRWAQANPDQLFYGHGGTGSMAQLLGAMIGNAAGLKFQDVPYKGGADLVPAIIGDQVHTGVTGAAEVATQYQAGRLKMLGVSSRVRAPGLPAVPTFVELGYPSVVSEPWFAFFAPRGTPAPAIAAWNKAINAALADAGLQHALSGLGYMVAGGTPDALKATVALDTARWRKVMDQAGFKTID